uniref:EF-hand domain-containing protein n=1 Tax=Eutreptiella gymnastica TaxID=73025 RepID=A0A6U7ZZX4_9EUGL|mmetsp:Transcript_151370/g.264446  ORF Transcript_151370/g.264446 Transcript_151370/m.264446 type:complete len:400 (+) Transcript_151370:126-1325(+)
MSKTQYSVGVLVGNWFEGKHDPNYAPHNARTYSDQEYQWQSEYRKSIASDMSDSMRRMDMRTPTPDLSSDTPYTSETVDQFGDPTNKSFTLRKFVGGKRAPPEDKPYEQRVADYKENWTVNSLRTRERMQSESRRALKSHKGQVHAQLRLFGIPTVDNMRSKIWKRGGKAGFRGVTRVLRLFDENGNNKLDRYELENALQTYGIAFQKEEMDQIMDYFDVDGSGQITITEMVRGLRGSMTEERKALVRKAYALLDQNGDGTVTEKDIRSLYDVSQHPDALSRSKTHDQVRQEYLGGWDLNGDGVVSAEEFMDYYEDVSTGIDSDEYFELMMRNAWHMSGGEGVCANTSCRRVLVLHSDGRNTVEEIKDDLGITADQIDRMEDNLRKQGIKDIKKIQLYN